MTDRDELADRFEAERGHLQSAAYRMLGSLAEAEDAVQEAWLRLERADVSDVVNLPGWLRTVVSRVCLDMLRSRAARREDLAGQQLPDESPDPGQRGDPEQEAILADSVGRALLVVLDRLGPAERIAFVLHDMLAVPFDEIAPIVDRSPVTTKKLASRARHRVRGVPVADGAVLARHRQVVGDRPGELEVAADLRAALVVLAGRVQVARPPAEGHRRPGVVGQRVADPREAAVRGPVQVGDNPKVPAGP